MNLSYHKDPYPHIVGSLDQELYDRVNSSWPKHENYIQSVGNRSNINLKDEYAFQSISKIAFDCHSAFAEDYIEHYPKLLENDVVLKCSINYCENSTSTTPYKIRGMHLDNGDKMLVGLWYFKHPEEEGCGGDLVLVNPLTKESKTVEYGSNVFLMFPNLPTSWHAITHRKPSKYPRRFVNIFLTLQGTKLHNYYRISDNVDSEFRGKIENYYK